MSTVLSIAGGVVQAFGQAYAAGSKANALRSQAKATQIAGTEAEEAAAFNADFTEQQSAIRQDQITRYGEKLQARATTIAAASGVDPGGGSVVLAAMDNAANIETDVMRTKFSGDLRAEQYRWEGSVARSMADYNAAVMKSEANVVQTLGDISFMSTALGSAAVAYQQSQAVTVPPSATTPYGTTQPADTTAPYYLSTGTGGVAPDTSGQTDMTGSSLLWD